MSLICPCYQDNLITIGKYEKNTRKLWVKNKTGGQKMVRYLLSALLVVSLFGCSKQNPVATPTPENTAAIFEGLEVAQPIYDISDQTISLSVRPQFIGQENVETDTIRVNLITFLDTAPIDSISLYPQSGTYSWNTAAAFHDSVDILVNYKWRVGDRWFEVTEAIGAVVVAQP